MNSLDWINRWIKSIKKQIEKLKNMINNFGKELSDSNNEDPIVSYLCLSEAQDKLQEGEYLLTIYQQIKTELEAWEEIKGSLTLNDETDNVRMNTYFKTTDYQKIKKALEVEENV